VSPWTARWLVWIALFFCLEIPALLNKQDGDTLSEHFWAWFHVKDSRHTPIVWVLRGALLVGLAWLFFHLGFGWFTPTHPLPGR